MNNAQRALLVAAGLFLTIALITLVVNLFSSAQEASKQAQNEFTTMQNELAATQFSMYDNAIVTGSQVKAAIRKYINREGFFIQVTTGKNRAAGESGLVYGPNGTRNLNQAEDVTSNHYINPSGKFKGQVIYDQNQVVIGIIFQQQ